MRTSRRRRPRAPWLALAVVLASLAGGGGLATRPARASLLEPPRARQGYYFGLGYHLALIKPWEDGESWKPWVGTNLSIRLGELITRRFGMGLQINFGGAKGQGQTASVGGLAIEAQFEVARNLSLQGAVGLDVVSLTSDDGSDESTRGTVGAGYALSLTYDWFFTKRLTGGWALTPTAQVRFVPGTTAYAFIGLLGVQISYWTGLPRNQLDLPPADAFKRQ